MTLRSEAGRSSIRPGHIVITLVAIGLALTATVFFSQLTIDPESERGAAPAGRVVVAAVDSRSFDLAVLASCPATGGSSPRGKHGCVGAQ